MIFTSSHYAYNIMMFFNTNTQYLPSCFTNHKKQFTEQEINNLTFDEYFSILMDVLLFIILKKKLTETKFNIIRSIFTNQLMNDKFDKKKFMSKYTIDGVLPSIEIVKYQEENNLIIR